MADTNASASTVIGYFESQTKAEQAIDALIEAGFTSKEIGVATRGDAGGTAATGTTGSVTSKASELGHAAGEKTEGAWEKVKSFFGGNDPVEPYADEKTQGAFASREVTSDDYSDYGHEDVHGSLEGLTGSGDHAKYFGGRMQQGAEGVVVTVTPSNFAKSETAERILEQYGADLGKNRESFAGTTSAATPALDADAQQNIKLYGEVLRVHKDRVSRGEVRLRKEVHTEMQSIQVPVTREELVIERVPVTGEQAVTGGADAFAEKEIRIPLSEERASVDKQAVLREEVHVGKREVASTESFNESVRSEDLKIDDATTETAKTYKQ